MSQPMFDFGDGSVDDPTNPTYGVAELADAINASMRRSFSDGVWVRGEISGLSNRGPHTYFSLVEETESGKAVLNVSLFAPMKRNLTPILKRNRLELSNGMKVRIFGHLDFYGPTGRLGLKMAGIDPRFTLGELSIARDDVIRRLVAGGLLDRNKRRPLSPVPLRIGVVASVGTAAWHDFHNELVGSGIGFDLAVVDTRVQGDAAARMIAAAVATLSRRHDLDVIVVIRGGGARNELATFDAEEIAVAIATSSVAVFTGLGHEVDRSVADEVAHTAWKTPTACAASLVDAVREYLSRSETAWRAIVSISERRIVGTTTDLSDRAHRIARRTHAAVERADERLNTRVDRLRNQAPAALLAADSKISLAGQRLIARPVPQLDAEAHRLDALEARVAAVDPAHLLARGWSITRRSDGRIVRSRADVQAGTLLETQLVDGRVTSRVEDAAATSHEPGTLS